jgi:arginine/lysine/ornithine decarboxylase
VLAVLGHDPFANDVLVSGGLDDRRMGNNYLGRAEELMAEAVGADAAWFSTCGSSLSVKAAMMAVGGAGNSGGVGGAGNSTAVGGAGNSGGVGGAGNSAAVGGAGNSTAVGGAGNSTAVGGAGNSTAVGGAGNSTGVGGLLIPRDSHKSIVAGLVFSGVQARWITPRWDADRHFSHPPSPQDYADTWDRYPDAAGALVVCPSPYGTCTDLAGIAEVCHDRGKPLIVDEAWGAHLPFHDDLPTWAMDAGADVCVVSVHKMGAGFEQLSGVGF